MLCRLAAANALVRNGVLLQRNAAGTNTGLFLHQIFTCFVAAPHCFDKSIALFL